MRFVTWNMGCGPRPSTYRKSHDKAWRYLLDELRPDVAIVQEAMHARLDRESTDRVVFRNKPDGLDSGTAILVRGVDAVGADPITAAETYAVSTRLTLPAGSCAVVGVHVYPGDQHQIALRSLAESFGAAAKVTPLIVAGDFNSARHFDTVYRTNNHKWFFDAMTAAGLEDAHWAKHGREKQSFWGRQAKEPYQDDHVFVSAGWADRVTSCDIVDNEVVRRLSDHGPVVFEVDVKG